MGFLKRWRQARRARCDAKAYLRRSGLADRLPALQQAELLRLRSAFSQEKMGQWSERATLYVRASRLPANACIVEVGSWVGVGTCYLAAGLRAGGGGRVYAVDTFRGSTLDARSQPAWAASVAKMGGSTLPLLRAHVRRFGLEALVTPIEADSAAAAAGYDGPPIDLLFIDGDHVYEAVRADFEAWWPRVRPGGLVMFHDYDERHPGVRRFVDEALMGPLRGCATEQVGALLSARIMPGEKSPV
jgi:predicted O-methyltransferase YrrM